MTRNDFPKLIQAFAVHKVTVQGRSQSTVDEYLSDLKVFCRYLLKGNESADPDFEIDISGMKDEQLTEVTATDVYDYLFYLREVRKDEKRSVNRKLSTLRQFYKYCVSVAKKMEVNPVGEIENLKNNNSLPKFLSEDECLLLLESVKNDTESETRERDYAIITLFLNTGIRLSELCGIDFSDIDRELRSMRVLGKGSKERIVYLNDACRSVIEAYLPVRLKIEAKADSRTALFVSSRHERISPKTVEWMVKKYLKAAGLENRSYSTHKLRHTAATLMYQSGEVDVRVLKDILGHEQLNTTQIYTHVSNRQMEEAMTKNPLSGISAEGLSPVNKENTENEKEKKEKQDG